MSTRAAADTRANVLVLINALLMLFGLFAFHFDSPLKNSGQWSPTPPPPAVDPYWSYRQPRT